MPEQITLQEDLSHHLRPIHWKAGPGKQRLAKPQQGRRGISLDSRIIHQRRILILAADCTDYADSIREIRVIRG
jgi:hypothetical protein